MLTYILISVILVLAGLCVYLLVARARMVDRAGTRVKNRYEKLISDQEYEIKRLNYLNGELMASSESLAAKKTDDGQTALAGVSLQTAEELLIEQKKLEADKEDLALRNRKLWDMSIQIQKDRQRIQLLKNELEFRHKSVQDSIAYAKRIQDAVLPREAILNDAFADHFLMWMPKETVSGDFYWMRRMGDTVIICVADCTGHGVPGAFMSMLGVTFLNEVCANLSPDARPSDILENLRKLVIDTLQQNNQNIMDPKDGMDLALCMVELTTRQIRFSGANNPLYIVRGGEIAEYKAVKNPIGLYPKLKPFETIDIQGQEGDYLYMFSDGFADQFNGETGKKVTYMKFRKLLCDINGITKDGAEQARMLQDFLTTWRGSFIQMDDVLIGGYRLK